MTEEEKKIQEISQQFLQSLEKIKGMHSVAFLSYTRDEKEHGAYISLESDPIQITEMAVNGLWNIFKAKTSVEPEKTAAMPLILLEAAAYMFGNGSASLTTELTTKMMRVVREILQSALKDMETEAGPKMAKQQNSLLN